jgi:hypothetical protein
MSEDRAISMLGPPLVALPLLKPEPATGLQMLLIALFLFFMINQHRRAHALLIDRQLADQNQRKLVQELQTAIAEVRTLEGILPICASSKRIKNEAGAWEAVSYSSLSHDVDQIMAAWRRGDMFLYFAPHSRVAQLVEQPAVNRRVAGSSPASGAP